MHSHELNISSQQTSRNHWKAILTCDGKVNTQEKLSDFFHYHFLLFLINLISQVSIRQCFELPKQNNDNPISNVLFVAPLMAVRVNHCCCGQQAEPLVKVSDPETLNFVEFQSLRRRPILVFHETLDLSDCLTDLKLHRTK